MIKFPTANGIATMMTKRETFQECQRMKEAQGPAMEGRTIPPRMQAFEPEGTTNKGKDETKRQLAALNIFYSKAAERALPYLDTLKKCTNKKDFHYTTEAKEAFQAIKKLIAELPTLTAPKKDKELMVYLSAANEAVSIVLLVERDGRQTSIHYVSRTLQGTETNYPPNEKLMLVLVHAVGQLKRHFQGHTIKHQIPLRSVIKGQVLADFLTDTITEDNPTRVKTDGPDNTLAEEESIEEQEDTKTKTPKNLRVETDIWMLYTYRASNEHRSRACLILIDPEGAKYSYALRLNFANSNNDVEYEAFLAEIVYNAWIKHSKDQFCAPTAQDIDILIQTCLMPLATKTQNGSFRFVHELKQEMHADLKYVESIEKEIDKLESDKAELSNMHDVILQECVSNDVKCSYLQSLYDLNALAELQCLYLHKVKECDGLTQKLSNQTESTKSVPKANASACLSKPVTAQTLPQTTRQAVSNTNVLKLGMYRIDNRLTQTRAPQLPHIVRNTNPRVSTSTGVNHRPNVSRPQHKSNQSRDKVLPNNSQVNVKRTQAEVHPRIPSVFNKIKSVTACKDSLNSRTLNANAVCDTCNKCLVDSNHFACVIKMLNDVNARTKKPNVVLISTRKPKSQASKSIATHHKKKIEQQSPLGYKWVPKPKMQWVPKAKNDHVQKRVSFAVDNASRITNVLKCINSLGSNLSTVPSSSNQIVQLILFIVDSGCMKHMTGNLKLLGNFVEKFPGTVRFGNDQFTLILGYGDLVQGNITIKRVYYVQGLNYNIFSVGQFCDANLEVAFRKSTCFVEIFRKDIVIGLPKLKYVKDQLCSSCEMSKAKRSSFKSKAVPSSKRRLNLLHMDLCGPMQDETPEVLKEFLTMIQRNLQAPVITIYANVSSQQELNILFGPLYDEVFDAGSNPQDKQPTTNIQPTSPPSTPTYVHAKENNNDQAEEQLQDDDFTNPFCAPAQEVDESSSHNIGNSNVPTFNQPQVSEYQWTKDHPLEQVHENPSRPVQTRRQLVTDPEMYMYALTVRNTESKNIKEAMADSAWIEAMHKELHQIDRLQHGPLKEEDSVAQPDGFDDLDHPEKVYRLRKALYGLKQAPRAWYDELSKFLTSKGFTKGQSIGTPMAMKPKLDADLSGNPIDQTDYHSKIGSLMYLTSSIPDIVQAVCFCARYQSRLTEKHLKEDKRIFRYLRGTVNMELWLYSSHVDEDITSRLWLQLQQDSIILTEYQLADMFTKALPEDRFKYFVRRIGMRYLTPTKLEVLAKESS
uniref:Reverse transcriptase/retrotransposon-derived protein RNase H-like domain-containing protein n=1 Tax=Tanacetum cinerariifolium TaxID=118510 RepID=A0A6L2N844_TANCI|nr:hypothetical protein [Tanacetum cinerariifolium]